MSACSPSVKCTFTHILGHDVYTSHVKLIPPVYVTQWFICLTCDVCDVCTTYMFDVWRMWGMTCIRHTSNIHLLWWTVVMLLSKLRELTRKHTLVKAVDQETTCIRVRGWVCGCCVLSRTRLAMGVTTTGSLPRLSGFCKRAPWKQGSDSNETWKFMELFTCNCCYAKKRVCAAVFECLNYGTEMACSSECGCAAIFQWVYAAVFRWVCAAVFRFLNASCHSNDWHLSNIHNNTRMIVPEIYINTHAC